MKSLKPTKALCVPRSVGGITLNRRRLLRAGASAAAALGAQSLLPAWARSGGQANLADVEALTGPDFALAIERTHVLIDGKPGRALTVNGRLPAPLLRWREGQTVTMRVTNNLEEDTSIHWHGILVPFQMDGVPGITYPGIRPGETFTYRFPVRQSGTYWYHSHTGLQEQLGLYGPLVIEPAGKDPVACDRDYVVMLSDWTFENPRRLFAKLKSNSDTYNFQERTAADFVDEAQSAGLGQTIKNRLMWGRMRMSPTDLADVTAATYTYLVNGHGPQDNWTALFEPGERVRLRFINSSAMTFFNLRIPGLPMTVVQADGQNVRPVPTDEIQIGVAETYDVIVQPKEDKAYTIMCESMDRSGYGRATLAPRLGMEADIPPLRPRPTLTMRDMGMAMNMDKNMDMGSGMDMSHDMSGQGHANSGGTMQHGSMSQGTMSQNTMDHGDMKQDGMAPMTGGAGSSMNMPAMNMEETMASKPDLKGPGIDNIAMEPSNRLGEPGLGLDNVNHRVLVYTQLKSLAPNPDARPPGRDIVLHLTGNMERYMWSFNGTRFAYVKDPILFHKGERVRLTMINDTMMAHPIHLHGMFFDVVTGEDRHKPRKHTIIVKPGEKLSVDVTADALGNWAFHCHLLYHMHAGMFQVVSVRDDATERPS